MRFVRSIPAALLVLALLLVAGWIGRAPDEALTGSATALDGDSLRIDGREMRLKGLDAPELRQMCREGAREVACGRRARAELARHLRRGPVTCIGNETDRYGRLLVTCRVLGIDIGAELVRNGFAVDYGGYPAEERFASEDRRGLWAGTFERPEAYRRRTRPGAGTS